MTVPQVNQYLTTLMGDGQSQTQQSVKPNNTALSPTPQDGGALMAGFDRTNLLQRHLNVNAQGSIIVGNTGGDAVTSDFDVDADVAKTLIGLLTNCRGAFFDIGAASDWKRLQGGSVSAVTGLATTAFIGPNYQAMNYGRDTNDSTVRAIESNVADVAAKFTKTLYGLLVNARLSSFRMQSADYVQLQSDTPTQASGEGTNGSFYWARVLAACYGRDTSDSSMRLIESRLASTTAQTPATLYRLYTDAYLRGLNNISSLEEPLLAMREASGVVGGMLTTTETRNTGYVQCLRGRRFAVTTEGTAVTASNGFTATTPRMTVEAGATNELLIRRIDVSVLVAGTTNMQIRVVLDPDARYSSGGTAVTLGARTNMNVASATNASFTAHYGGITATATDADEREIHYGIIPNSVGGRYTIEFEDGLICGASGTILIYIMDAGGTGTAAINIVLEDANVQ